ncbi:signal transduction histidine kinase [Clavibacter sp. B3I6]|uniref:sensor histidine kinase n=1 Tax=Clavibacter sp. B3I6 TaxID=3042268 RepID=UPI002787098E|nr:histidine kinase [Clavibacter sp. B3I6]MDQ0745103.1 signal transduction histidine kinase [Clavibacter sp. B3I6]
MPRPAPRPPVAVPSPRMRPLVGGDPLTGGPMSRRRRPPVWIGDLLASILVVVLAFARFPGGEYRADDPLTFALALAPVAVLPFRRRRPIPVLVACLALFGAAAFAGLLAPGIVLSVAIAMFVVANRLDRRAAVTAAACSVVAVVGLSLLAAVGSVFDPRTFQFAVMTAFAAAAGDATRSRREFIAAVTERAERAEQTRESEARRRVTEERLRIARDLHDAVAHQIAVISLNAGVASSAVDTRPEKAKEALVTIRSASRAVLREIGDLLEMLRHGEDAGEGAGSAAQPGLDRLEALVEQFATTGLEVSVRIEGDRGALRGAPDLVAYRVVQEALTNAHKHGSAGRAHVLVEVGDREARIVVTNPVPAPAGGAGGDAVRVDGHGLLGLRERVDAVRGSIEAGSAPGGWRLAATLPLTREGRA